MTDHPYETEITVDDKVPMVRIIREFAASPEQVFRAHTDAALYAQWVGPRNIETRIEHFDCRTGGSWRYQAVRNDDTDDFAAGFHGSFHEVRPNELIVQTFTFDGMPDQVALERLVFERLGDHHTRLVSTSLVDSFEDRDAFVASGMESGVKEGYEKLDELLADVSS